MTLPTANPTKPSAPLNLAIESLNGLLVARRDAPVVKPLSTRFQMIRSPGSASAVQSGLVVWEGAESPAVLPWTYPSSRYWYHARAFVGSEFSAFSPNTIGVLAMPSPQGVNPIFGDVVPDGEFFSGINVGSWWQYQSGLYPGVTLVGTGGVVNDRGKIRFSANTTIGGVLITPISPTGTVAPGYLEGSYPVSPGQRVSVYLTYRRTGTLTGSSVTGGLAGFGWVANAQVSSSNGNELSVTLPTSAERFIRCDNLPLNTWTTAAFSYQIPTTDNFTRLDPFLVVHSEHLTGGEFIEIGRFQISRS